MDYTYENGRYYKVLDAFGNIITIGELTEGLVLSTLKEVVFISKEEFDELELHHL